MFSCDAARRRTLSYVEGHLPADEMQRMRRHLALCPMCAEESGTVYELRRNLKSLPLRVAPPDLRVRLRVMASHEAARRRSRRSFAAVWATWMLDVRLWKDNLMRPLAIPTAGGFASALVLFSVFATGLTVPTATASSPDVPTGLYTEASVKSCMPIGFDSSDLMVELTIDDQGRVTDYTIPDSIKSPLLRRSIEKHLLFTQFHPATSFGQPTAGKARLWFRSSRIDVKG